MLSCLVVSDSLQPLDCSPWSSSFHRIFQAKILEWVAIFSSRGSSWPRDQTHISCIAGRFFTIEQCRKPPKRMCLQDVINIVFIFFLDNSSLFNFTYPISQLIFTLYFSIICAVLCLLAQSHPPLCDSMYCSPPGSSVHGDSPGKNTGVGCHIRGYLTLLQGIFTTQGLNPSLLHCWRILYHLSQQGRPDSSEVAKILVPCLMWLLVYFICLFPNLLTPLPPPPNKL